MSAKADRAVAMFVDGFSCAQSLLATYGPDLGLERETALKVAAPFAGGVSRTDGPCGAGSGALLVLGLKYGHTSPDDEAGEERVRSLVQEFLRRYEARKGCTDCTGLLGANLAVPADLERVKEEDLAQRVCPDLVRTSCEILEELLDHPDQEFPA
mgnify:CR=1 FL=1